MKTVPLERIEIPIDLADVALARIAPFYRLLNQWDEHALRTFALSCYQQGLMDGNALPVREAVDKLLRDEEWPG